MHLQTTSHGGTTAGDIKSACGLYTVRVASDNKGQRGKKCRVSERFPTDLVTTSDNQTEKALYGNFGTS